MSNIFVGVDFKNMPPCKKVLMNKIERSQYLARMMKNSVNGTIDKPGIGWILSETGDIEIDYFSGDPFPEDVATLPIDLQEDSEDEEGGHLSSSDEEYDERDDSDDEWEPNK